MTLGSQRGPASVGQINAQVQQAQRQIRDGETCHEGKYGYASIHCPHCGKHVIVDAARLFHCDAPESFAAPVQGDD